MSSLNITTVRSLTENSPGNLVTVNSNSYSLASSLGKKPAHDLLSQMPTLEDIIQCGLLADISITSEGSRYIQKCIETLHKTNDDRLWNLLTEELVTNPNNNEKEKKKKCQ